MVRIEIEGIVLSIDSNRPDSHGAATWSENTILAEWLPIQFGMFGHRVGENPCPNDAIAALIVGKKKYRVIEGQEILDMPQAELPEGAIW